ncbi:MAG: MCE family protein [Kiritimatiellae bacterium]|nr:MCE family protein [Kiritimatiellia bacterium]
MNENKSNFAKIGFFILSGFILILIALAVASSRVLNQEKVFAETYFTESVAGLDSGSPVKYRGVPVGSVEEIGFVYGTYEKNADELPNAVNMRQIRVVLSLEPKKFGLLGSEKPERVLKHLVDQGLRVKITSSGVTGLSFLELDYFEGGKLDMESFEWKSRHQVIPSISSTMKTLKRTMDEVIVKLSNIDFRAIGDRFVSTMDLLTNRLAAADVEGISRESTNLLRELRTSNADLQKILQSVQSAGIGTCVTGVADSANTMLDSIKSDVDGVATQYVEVATMLRALLSTNAASIAGLAGALEQTAQSLNTTMKQQSGNISDILQNVRDATGSFRDLLQNLSENPAAVIFGQPPPPLEEDKKEAEKEKR